MNQLSWKWRALAGALLCFIFYISHTKSENKVLLSQTTESKEIDTKRQHQASTSPEQSHVKPTKRELASEDVPSFSFQQELSKVRRLTKDWPQSKPEILQMILQPDPFKEKEQEVKAHSLSELQQNQRGAIKVMALRSLMENSKNQEQLGRDLQRIVDQSQDPTMARIAQAALESLGRGRRFFDDFLDSLARLEAPAD